MNILKTTKHKKSRYVSFYTSLFQKTCMHYTTKHKRDVSRLQQIILAYLSFNSTFLKYTHTERVIFEDPGNGIICLDNMDVL